VVELGIQDRQQLGHRFRQMFKVVQILEYRRLGAYESQNASTHQPGKNNKSDSTAH
jgi:hypothetical protein